MGERHNIYMQTHVLRSKSVAAAEHRSVDAGATADRPHIREVSVAPANEEAATVLRLAVADVCDATNAVAGEETSRHDNTAARAIADLAVVLMVGVDSCFSS